jgi:murein DD-endopeptidase MepM/ murein hydrolase activator NlpD
MKLSWPIKGIGITPGIYITQKFGEHLLDYSQFGLVGHNGIDITCPFHTPIYACADGWIIEQTDKPTGYGLRISQLVQDGNSFFVLVYGHFNNFSIDIEKIWNFFSKTTYVKAGDLLGYADSTGFSTGHHLHLGIYEYDMYSNKKNPNNGYGGAIDPIPFMKIRVPKWIGYKKSKQKDLTLPLPDLDTHKKIINNELKLTDVYDFGEYELTYPIDKPLFQNNV